MVSQDGRKSQVLAQASKEFMLHGLAKPEIEYLIARRSRYRFGIAFLRKRVVKAGVRVLFRPD